jgi:hypothetical protein
LLALAAVASFVLVTLLADRVITGLLQVGPAAFVLAFLVL